MAEITGSWAEWWNTGWNTGWGGVIPAAASETRHCRAWGPRVSVVAREHSTMCSFCAEDVSESRSEPAVARTLRGVHAPCLQQRNACLSSRERNQYHAPVFRWAIGKRGRELGG